MDYNPFDMAKNQIDLSTGSVKEPPQSHLPRLREILSGVNHVLDRAFIAIQLKPGLRAGEVASISISELTLGHDGVQNHYHRMGARPVSASTAMPCTSHTTERGTSQSARACSQSMMNSVVS